MSFLSVPGRRRLAPAHRSGPEASDASGEPASRPWAGFLVVSLGMLMTFLNITATVSALGPIRADVHASSTDIVWIASIYSMLVASFVLAAGTLGDIIGRRRVFALGTLVLGVGSLVTFLGDSAGAVILGQAVMGFGGALILPNSLAIVTNSFTEPQERTRAVSIWISISGIGLAVGPLAAGGLLESFSWHSVFLINVVIAAVVLVLIFPLVAESRHPSRRFDPAGLVLAVVSIAALNYGVIEGGDLGFGSARVVAAFVVAVVAGLGFLAAESRAASPMIELSLFRNRSFSTANGVGLVAQYVFVGIALAEVLYFEQVRHETILNAGLKLLPLTAGYVVVSAFAARLVQRVGFKVAISVGMLLSAAGVLLILAQQPDSSFASTGVLLALIGVGAGVSLPPATSAAVLSVPHSEGGMASATVNTFRQVGNTLGASITGTILTSGLASRLPDQLTGRGVPSASAQRVADAVTNGGGVGSDTSPGLARTIDNSIGDAFVGSLHIAALVPGIAGGVAALAAAAFIVHRPAKGVS